MTTTYEIVLAITVIFLLGALGWSVVLRRKVREQTEQIRRQFLREIELQNQYKELFENANDVIFSLDASGAFTSLNRSGERVTGYSQKQALTFSFREMIAFEQSETFDVWLATVGKEQEGARCEFSILSKGGSSVILEVSARPIFKDRALAGFDGIARDITSRKKAEEALHESEERFASAFRVSPVAIAIQTLEEDRFQDVNESFLRLFGFEAKEVVGATSSELSIWANVEEKQSVKRLLLDKRSVGGMECHFRTKSGQARSALVFMEQLKMGNVPCALFLAYDITDRQNLEAQLRQSQKLEAIGRLAAGVAHDFNNLLTVIQGNIELSQTRHQLPPELQHSMEQVSMAAQKAAALVRQLLTFSRKQVMAPKQIKLNDVITNYTKMLKHLLRPDMDLKFSFAPNLPELAADLTMMEQVLLNLTVNARDAMNKGGQLTIGTNVLEIDLAYLQRHPEARMGRAVCLSVTDTGCGMDAATQARMFEPFFTTKPVDKGTGLGLATVYGVVKQHKGWIEVESVLGQGTTFRIYFPSDQKVPQAPSRSVPRVARTGPETILVVEDDATVAEFVRSLLKGNGFNVLEAANGLEAMELWNVHSAEIDLLLTDMVMPKGMSGADLAENLTSLRPDLRVIYTSGHSQEAFNCRLELREGFNYLAKPYAPPRLLQTIRYNLKPEAGEALAA